MIRSTVADVDLDAIAHNFRAIRDFLRSEVQTHRTEITGTRDT